MQRVLKLMLFLAVCTMSGHAQPAWYHTDSLTYSLYVNKDWKQLLAEANRSLQDGVDFYYLRVRAGIAAYELRKFRLAASHLAKAHAWNTDDEFVNYWLYFALLKGSRSDEANILASGFDADYLRRMNIRPVQDIHYVQGESMISVNRSYHSLLGETIGGDYSYMGYRNVLKHQFYNALGIDHKIAPRVYAFHGINHLGIQRMQMFRSPAASLNEQIESTTNQFQYYFQGRVLPGDGWLATLFGTILTGSSHSNYMTFNQGGVPLLSNFRYNINDWVIGASAAKDFIWFQPALAMSWGNINALRQIQAAGQLVLYPLGNQDVYFVSRHTVHRDEGAREWRHVFLQKVGFRVGPIWLTPEITFGRIRNFVASDGYVVYNMPETIRNPYGISAIIPLLQYRLDVSARYQFQKKQGTTFDYATPVEYQATPYTYSEKSFLISLKWYL